MSTSYGRAWLVVAVGLSAAVGVGACSPSRTRSPEAATGYQSPQSLVLRAAQVARIVAGLPPSSPQRPLLRDGRVTQDELASSWRQLRSCLESHGMSVSGPTLNPITNTEYLYTYASRGTSVHQSSSATGAEDATAHRCEQTYWTPVSLVYAANTPQHMSSQLARFMADCMTSAHYVTARGATFDDIVRGKSASVDPQRLRQGYQCLDEGMPRLYPQLPYFPRP